MILATTLYPCCPWVNNSVTICPSLPGVVIGLEEFLVIVNEDAGVTEVCARVMSGELAREVQVGVDYVNITAIGECHV